MGRNENKVRKGLANISSVCTTDIVDVSNKILEHGAAIAATGETSNANSLVINTLESINDIVELLDFVSVSLNDSNAHNSVIYEAKEKDMQEAIRLGLNKPKIKETTESDGLSSSHKLLAPSNKFETNYLVEK